MDTFLMGAIAMSSFIAGLFFLRFWRDTRDRLFLIFAVAFWLLGITRLVLVLLYGDSRPGVAAAEHADVYWVRLAAFVLIVVAIVDKNRPRRSGVIDPKRGAT